MLMSITARNSVGRIAQGDILIVDVESEVEIGNIVVCSPDDYLEFYSEHSARHAIGKVIKFYANPLNKTSDMAPCPKLQAI